MLRDTEQEKKFEKELLLETAATCTTLPGLCKARTLKLAYKALVLI